MTDRYAVIKVAFGLALGISIATMFEKWDAASSVPPDTNAVSTNSLAPSPEFIEGFEKGIQFGVATHLMNPGMTNIADITREAKETYAKAVFWERINKESNVFR